MKSDEPIVIKTDGDGCEMDGIYYQDAVSALVCGVLNGCGCGCPEDALRVAADIAEAGFVNRQELFRSMDLDLDTPTGAGIAYGLMYWLDGADLLEHGCEIMGAWLTKRGKSFVRLAREALNEVPA